MLIITTLNFVKKFKSFIYTKAQWASGNDPVIEILVEPRSNSRPLCGQLSMGVKIPPFWGNEISPLGG